MPTYPLRARCALLAVFLLSFAHCRAKDDDTPTPRDADDARHIRVESGVEAVRDLSRLYSLYLPEASVVADDTRTMGTDAHGHATMRIPRQENECIDLLIDSAEDEEHKVLVAAFGGGGVTEGAARQAPPESRVLSYDSGRATAWILPQICDAGSSPITLHLQGLPELRYQVQIHRRSSDAVDRALFAQAHRDLPGFRAYGPLQRDVLAHNARRSMPLAVSGDRCIAIAAHAEAPLEDLDAVLLNLHGDRLALEVATDASSIVGPYCPRQDEIIRVEFRAYTGQGRFRWQRWETHKDIGQRLLDARLHAKDGAIDPTLDGALWRDVLAPLPLPKSNRRARGRR